jgi:hypothetical protein
MAPAYSLMDSLWQAPLPVDTVILEERSGKSPQSTDNIFENRHGPASAEIGPAAGAMGYRVQLASAEIKKDLETLALGVEREFETKVYLDKFGDRFYLRIGDFLEKSRAQALREKAVSYGYRHAWIVQTPISIPASQLKE